MESMREGGLMNRRIAFIDRDGTLIKEPADQQVDRIDKIELMEDVIWALQKLSVAGFELVVVSNQDGLGTGSFPQADFDLCQNFMTKMFLSQGIRFSDVRICPHLPSDACRCRKPGLGLIKDYLKVIDRSNSLVIGDRHTDIELAENMGIRGIQLTDQYGWKNLVRDVLFQVRTGTYRRETKETNIFVEVFLDGQGQASIQTGIHFFDHMLEQIAKHSGVSLNIQCEGDLKVDDHHTVEDVGLALGQALSLALGDRRGIERYGCLLPMDESLAEVAIDLGGRPFLVFSGQFSREKVGDLSVEMVSHFFRSLADSLRATLNIKVNGENTHHMVEASFKGFARALKAAIVQGGDQIPSTKGLLV
jgi:imidazoleglycerol-phosphate dehydratase/histidinol-phosphatase